MVQESRQDAMPGHPWQQHHEQDTTSRCRVGSWSCATWQPSYETIDAVSMGFTEIQGLAYLDIAIPDTVSGHDTLQPIIPAKT